MSGQGQDLQLIYTSFHLLLVLCLSYCSFMA